MKCDTSGGSGPTWNFLTSAGNGGRHPIVEAQHESCDDGDAAYRSNIVSGFIIPIDFAESAVGA